MSVKVKQKIALFIAAIITIAGMQFITAPAAHAATLDSVREAIQGLSADPTSFKASDRDRVEYIWAEYNSLLPEDWEILDNDSSHSSGSSQPLSRILEAAYWAVLSYDEVDATTTLPDGEYNEKTAPRPESFFNSGKDKYNEASWSIKSVTVADGKATATLMVNNESFQKIWIGGKEYEKTNISGNSEFAGIPIDIYEPLYFAGILSEMQTPIAYSITIIMDEPASDYPPKHDDPKSSTYISIVKKSNVKTIKAGGKKLKKQKTFTVKTKATSGAKTTYKPVTKGRISVSKTGKVTLKKGLKKGRYRIKVKVSVPATKTALAATKTITIKVVVKK